MKQVALRLPDELATKIDQTRGDVPREVWLRRAAERALGEAVADAAENVREVARAKTSTRVVSDRTAATRPLGRARDPRADRQARLNQAKDRNR